ncbi:MAG: protein-L-isoaspartate O-methyltransferase family protein, partial [Anaeromyxobacteraceae bacterium]
MSRALADHLVAMGIRDPRVLEAIARTPRERFVRDEERPEAELDRPLPIGYGQTISQPYI